MFVIYGCSLLVAIKSHCYGIIGADVSDLCSSRVFCCDHCCIEFDCSVFCRPEIFKTRFASEDAIEPLIKFIGTSLRHLIEGAKMFALCERRNNLTCEDLNAYMKFQHQRVIFCIFICLVFFFAL